MEQIDRPMIIAGVRAGCTTRTCVTGVVSAWTTGGDNGCDGIVEKCLYIEVDGNILCQKRV
jgi:hypothetical protein